MARVILDRHKRQSSAIARSKQQAEANRNKPAPLSSAPSGITPLATCATATLLHRSDLGLAMYPGIVSACSVSHTLRNIAVALHRCLGIEVRWGQKGRWSSTPDCPSYLGVTEQLHGLSTQPYLTMTWDIELDDVLRATPLQRGILCVATTDHSGNTCAERVRTLNRPEVKAVFALSPLCRDTLVDAGVDEDRLHLLPLGVSGAVYRPDGPPYVGPSPVIMGRAQPDADAKRFVCVGYMQKRKGIVETVAAFCDAFAGRTDVCLIIKNVELDWGLKLRASRPEIEKTVNGRPDAPPVAYLGATLTEWEMAAFLREAWVLVNAHHREGFGLTPLQAMACGVPVIVTDYHGPSQYATSANAYLLPVTGNGPEEGVPGGAGQQRTEWALYEQHTLSQLMVSAADGKQREQRVKHGLAEARKWTWERSAETVAQVVENNIGHLRRRPRKWTKPGSDFSVVLPVRNGYAKLATTLRSLYDGHQWREVLVYDDASMEVEGRAISALCDSYNGCRLLRGGDRVGCHGARAIMFEEAVGEFIVSIDSDMDFSVSGEHWADRMMAMWDERGHGIMHPLLIRPSRRVQSAGGMIGPATGRLCLHRFEGEPEDAAGVIRPARSAYCCGAFQFFHASLLDEIAQDAEYTPAYFGDVDFCYRARAAGYPVWYCPEVTVIHDAGSWGATDEGKKQANLAATQARFLERWGDMVDEDRKRQDATGAL